MPTIVEVDGQEFEFPDGMSRDQIKDALDKRFAQQETVPLEGLPGYEPPAPMDERPEPTMAHKALGAVEALGTLATGATGGAVGFVGGTAEQLVKEIFGGDFGSYEAANRIAQNAADRASQFTYLPRTETGQEIVETIGEVAGQLPVTPQAASYQAAIRPGLAIKMGRHIDLIDPNNLPTKALQKSLKKADVDFSVVMEDVDTLPIVSKQRSSDDVVNAIVKKRIQQGSGNQNLYNKMLKGGAIVEDPLGEEAARQGFRPGDIASAKNSSVDTRKSMSKMLEMKRQIEGDPAKAIEFRPSDVAGDEIVKRIDLLKDKSFELRNDLNSIASKFEGVKIDTTPVEDTVISRLRRINVDIPEDVLADTTKLKEAVKAKDFFAGSDISKDKTSQKVIKDVVDLLSEDGADALRAHRVKRQIDTMIDYRKKQFQGLTATGQNFAKAVRKSLNDSVREISPSYAKTNDELSKILGSMEMITDAMPKKVDLDAPGASGAIGQELRKLLSNYASRQELNNSIKTLDDVAREFGGDFKVDVNRLVQFNNTLDDRFRPTARGSFKAEIGSAVGRELDVKEMAKQKALGKVIESIEKFRGINDEEAFNTMQKLLKRDVE